MLIHFFLAGRLPDLNEVVSANRANRYGGAKLKSGVTNSLTWQIRALEIEPLVGCHDYHFTWCEPDRRRDPDNIYSAVKFIFDALQKAGVIDNDGWTQVGNVLHTSVVSSRVGVDVRIMPHGALLGYAQNVTEAVTNYD